MATGALAPIGIQQFCDAAGVPLAGGSVTTSLTGTSTLAATYTDIDLASPSHLNANPVVLDSAGRATIFIPRGTGYRFVIKDSAGATVKTVDGILIRDDTYTHTANVEVPIGALLPYCGTAAPASYLLCDGTSYLRADYAALFGVCGVLWGSADSTHFNVPDMRGYFPFGKATAGTGSTLGGSFGTIDHVHAGGAHTHTTAGATASDGAVAVTGATAAGGTGAVTGATATGTADIGGTDLTSVATTGGATAAGADTHDDGHTHDAGTLAGPSHTHAATGLTGGAHTHAYGTLSAASGGTANTAAGNPPGVAFNFIVRYE